MHFSDITRYQLNFFVIQFLFSDTLLSTKWPANRKTQATKAKMMEQNHACLERIFMNLDSESLLNVAKSSKLFRKLAKSVYKREIGDSVIELHPFPRDLGEDDWFFVFKLEYAFPFLRVFGAEILKLNVSFDWHDPSSQF